MKDTTATSCISSDMEYSSLPQRYRSIAPLTLHGLFTAGSLSSRRADGSCPRTRFSTRPSSRLRQRQDVELILQEALAICRCFDAFDDRSKHNKKDSTLEPKLAQCSLFRGRM
jgi:hypothetical protein